MKIIPYPKSIIKDNEIFDELVEYFNMADDAMIVRDIRELRMKVKKCGMIPICLDYKSAMLPFTANSAKILDVFNPEFISFKYPIKCPPFKSMKNNTTIVIHGNMYSIPYTRVYFDDIFGYKDTMTEVWNDTQLIKALRKNGGKDIYLSGSTNKSIVSILGYSPDPAIFKTWAISPLCYKINNLFDNYKHHPQIEHWNVSSIVQASYAFASSGVRNLSMLHFNNLMIGTYMFASSSLEHMPHFYNVSYASVMFGGTNIVDTANFNTRNLYDGIYMFMSCHKLEHVFNNCVFRNRPHTKAFITDCPNVRTLFNNCHFTDGIEHENTPNVDNHYGKVSAFNNCLFIDFKYDVPTCNFDTSFRNTILKCSDIDDPFYLLYDNDKYKLYIKNE